MVSPYFYTNNEDATIKIENISIIYTIRMAIIMFNGIPEKDDKDYIISQIGGQTWGYIQNGNYCLSLQNDNDAHRIAKECADMILSIEGLDLETNSYGTDLNNQIKTLLDSIKFEGLIDYLQMWAKYNTFPERFPIDYESLNKLDLVRDLIINRNDIISLMVDYGDVIIGTNTMNCISIKNITNKTIYNRFKLLAYVCATIGTECYESARAIEICKYNRLLVMSHMLDYLCGILDEMSDKGMLETNYNELDYILMADSFSLEHLEIKDDFFIEKQKQCREKHKSYPHLSKEEIIRIGDEYHHKIKNFLLTSTYLDK